LLQHVVAHGAPVERSAIVNKFTGHVVSMSHQKFASNVIEKCLMVGSFQDRQLIATEILSAGGFHRRRLGVGDLYIILCLPRWISCIFFCSK
jgi:hypothetical protein